MWTLAITLLLIASGPLGARSLPEEQAIRSERLNFVLISDDGQHIAALGPGGFKLWDRDPVHLIGAFGDPASRANAWWFTAWAFSPDGKTLAVSDVEGTVGLYGTQRGDLARRLTVSESNVSSLAFSPDGRLLGITS